MNIVDDFVTSGKSIWPGGAGYFSDDMKAVSLARMMSKSQIRKYVRYGIVPGGFIEYLKSARIIPRQVSVPRTLTIIGLCDFLWDCPYDSDPNREAGLHIREQLLKGEFPMLRKAMGSSEYLWHGATAETI